MIDKLGGALRRRLGPSEGDLAVRPVLAGYRRPLPRLLVVLSLSILAVACLALGVAFAIAAPIRMTPFALPLVFLGALILWCLPPGEYAPTRLLEPLFVAFFAALILWPNYLAIAFASLPWVTMLRLTGVPMVIALLACISISKRFRSHLMEILQSERPMFYLVVALSGLWTFSLLLSTDLGDSLNKYALALVNYIGIFFASCLLFTRRGFGEFWATTLLIMLFIVCLVGLWELKLYMVPWVGHIPSFLRIDDPVVQRILSSGFNRIEIYRVKATATTPLGLGEILGLAMPFAMHYALGRYPLILRIVGAACVPTFAWLILLTDSRLGFVAACASALFYLLIWALLKWKREKESLFAPALVLSYPALFVAFMAATFLVGRLRNEFWGTGQQQFSTQSRLDQWASGMPKIAANPLGYGVGQGGRTLGWTNLAGTLTIDSYWLTILLEIGVIGFFVFYGLILRGAFVAAKTALQAPDEQELRLLVPMSVALLNFVIVKMVFSQDANHPLIFMILGAVVALTYRAGKTGLLDVTGLPAKRR